MPTDLYTKAILTIIAVALICLVLRDAPPIIQQAHAADTTPEVVKVQIVGIDEASDLRWEPLPVKIK